MAVARTLAQRIRAEQLGRQPGRNQRTRDSFIETSLILAVLAALNAHIADTTAHPASSITFDDVVAALGATDVQAAIEAMKALFDAFVATPEVPAIYFGDSTTDGTWRIIPDGTSLKHQRRESGTWVDKLEVLA